MTNLDDKLFQDSTDQDVVAVVRAVTNCFKQVAAFIELNDAFEDEYTGTSAQQLALLIAKAFVDTLSDNELIRSISLAGDDRLIVVNTKGKFIVSINSIDTETLFSGATGSCFAIYHASEQATPFSEEQFFRTNDSIIAAGASIYGASVKLMMSVGLGTDVYALDRITGDFNLVSESVRVPKIGQVIMLKNNKKSPLDHVRLPTKRVTSQNKTFFYSPSTIVNFFYVMAHGGVLGQDLDSETNLKREPSLLHTIAPLWYLMRHANGASSFRNRDLMDAIPDNIKQSVNFTMGSKLTIKKVKQLLISNDT